MELNDLLNLGTSDFERLSDNEVEAVRYLANAGSSYLQDTPGYYAEYSVSTLAWAASELAKDPRVKIALVFPT